MIPGLLIPCDVIEVVCQDGVEVDKLNLKISDHIPFVRETDCMIKETTIPVPVHSCTLPSLHSPSLAGQDTA